MWLGLLLLFSGFKCIVEGSVRWGTAMLVVLEFLVFRNHLCMWQYGFIHDIGPSNVLMAKLWSILTGLQKTDSGIWFKGGYSLIQNGCFNIHSYSNFVNSINVLVKRQLEFSHAYRESNDVVTACGLTHTYIIVTRAIM